MEVMQLAYDGGRHVVERGDVVGYEEVQAVRVDFCEGEKEERWRRICIDGMIVVVEDGGWVEVKKGGREVVRLVVPGEGGREIFASIQLFDICPASNLETVRVLTSGVLSTMVHRRIAE
ncbi:hypothetical protein ACJ72_02689 [Emergomyces africanus]|uniref:Uncharacterized protein n=1 Tax=Emergomyces africanus TaxID=1955775 RepID=A0A1B7P1Q4_9EURO|nr:hypothetical protein ACJ72_02689 [Emergomyces africanus]